MSCSERCMPAGQPHEHCICGLPMGVQERTCWLCQLEGLDSSGVGHEQRLRSPAVWDGHTYLSRRQSPRCHHDPELFDWLVIQIVGSRAAIDALRAGLDEEEPAVARRPVPGNAESDHGSATRHGATAPALRGMT
jgi:hypothetical protein